MHWGAPYSEVDYSGVENGCPGVIGATWEPDECLPQHLDRFRIAAKKTYVVRQRKLEQLQQSKVAASLKRKAHSEAVDPPRSPRKEEDEELKQDEAKKMVML